MDAISRVALQKPWSVLALVAIALWVTCSRLPALAFDPSYQRFFDADDPRLQQFEAIRGTFAASDGLVLVLVADSGSMLEPERLALLGELTDAAWRLPFALRVDSLANFPDVRSAGDALLVEALVDPAYLPDADATNESAQAWESVADRARTLLRTEPLVRGRLLAEDERAAAVRVAFLSDADPLEAGYVIDGAVDEFVRTFDGRAGVRLHRTGIVAMNHAFAEATLEDGALWYGALLVLLAVGLVWLLGSVRAALAVLLCVGAACALAIGAGTWFGIVLTTPSAVAPLVIATVGIADGVHLVLGYAHARDDGRDVRGAWADSLRENAAPVFWTSVTTAAGFLSLRWSEVPPFRDLGTIAAVGVLAAGILSLTALPAMMGVLPGREPRPRVHRVWLGALHRTLVRRPGPVLACGLLLLALMTAGTGRIRLDDDFVGYFSERTAFRRGADAAQAHLAGVHDIEYRLAAADGAPVVDPDYVRALDRFARWLRSQPEVRHVAAWSDVVRRVDRALADTAPAAADPSPGTWPIPESAARIAAARLVLSMGLPPGQDLRDVIAPDDRSTRLVVAFEALGSRAFIAMEARIERWLREQAPELVETHGSVNLLFSHISQRNVAAMIQGNLIAVTVIGLMLALALRSALLTGLSFATNLLPVAAAFGLWGWFVGDVGLSLSTAMGMTLGIVVDDTVHLLTRYARARRSLELDRPGAVAHVLQGVGPALVVTTLVLALGFAALLGSNFLLNGHLGAITALTILLALAVDLTVVPALLLLLGRRGRGRSGA